MTKWFTDIETKWSACHGKCDGITGKNDICSRWWCKYWYSRCVQALTVAVRWECNVDKETKFTEMLRRYVDSHTIYMYVWLPATWGWVASCCSVVSHMGFSVVHVNVISLIMLRIMFKVVSSTVLPHNDTDYMYQAQPFNHFLLISRNPKCLFGLCTPNVEALIAIDENIFIIILVWACRQKWLLLCKNFIL